MKKGQPKTKGGNHSALLKYCRVLGYRNVSLAIGDIGKDKLIRKFKSI